MFRLGIFVFYSKNRKVNESVKHYLSSLTPFFARIIIVSNSCLPEGSLAELKRYSSDIIFRENRGYDVLAWKTGIEYVGYKELASYDELILLNDSVYAPVFPLAEMFEKMESRDDLDFWGPTGFPRRERIKMESNPSGYIEAHIQSYFIALKKTVIQSDCFRAYWENMPQIQNREEAIGRHETYFTYYLSCSGYRWDTYVPVPKADSKVADLIDWDPVKACREYRLPFVKKNLFTVGRCGIDQLRRELFDYISYMTDFPEKIICDEAMDSLLTHGLWVSVEAVSRYLEQNNKE